jgi:hypothetical protein
VKQRKPAKIWKKLASKISFAISPAVIMPELTIAAKKFGAR